MPPAPIVKSTRTTTSRPPSTSQLGFQRRCSSSARPLIAAADAAPVPSAGLACGAVSGRAGPVAAEDALGGAGLVSLETLAESASRSRLFCGFGGGSALAGAGLGSIALGVGTGLGVG